MDQIKEFLNFIKVDKFRQFNFFAALFIFCLIPVQNYDPFIENSSKPPVARFLDFDLPEISKYPVNVTGQIAPQLTAISALAIDLSSKTIIYSKNPDYKIFPASTTKIMTALVSLDYYNLDDILTARAVKKIGRVMELEEGEEISFENLLYGLLVQSGNDAAYVLAENYSGGLDEFVKAMNKKAKTLHLDNTNFVNPAGIDANGQFITAHDLTVLAVEALNNPVIRKAVAISEIKITDKSGEIEHELTNINELLDKVAGLKGIKTGWTEGAGECLVAYTERGDKEIITAVLASQDRFGETERLIEWVYKNFQWESL